MAHDDKIEEPSTVTLKINAALNGAAPSVGPNNSSCHKEAVRVPDIRPKDVGPAGLRFLNGG